MSGIAPSLLIIINYLIIVLYITLFFKSWFKEKQKRPLGLLHPNFVQCVKMYVKPSCTSSFFYGTFYKHFWWCFYLRSFCIGIFLEFYREAYATKTHKNLNALFALYTFSYFTKDFKL